MEQKQEEGFERHAHARSRPFSTYRSSLQLIEPLRICLLAVAHRYPTHSLDIDEAVLGPQEMGAEGWRTTDLIELLQEVAPRLLPALARLEVTLQRRGIYLLDSSEEVAAFWLHCGEEGERMPIHRGNLATRRAELARRRAEAVGTVPPPT